MLNPVSVTPERFTSIHGLSRSLRGGRVGRYKSPAPRCSCLHSPRGRLRYPAWADQPALEFRRNLNQGLRSATVLAYRPSPS
jgi:hypothetical protein